MPLEDLVPHTTTRCCRKIFHTFSNNVERHGNRHLCLVQVSNVVDERSFVAGVDKSKAGRASEGHDDRVHDSVQGRVCRRKRLVDGIRGFEVVRPVITACPRNSGATGMTPVNLANACAFLSAKLLHCHATDIFIRESHAIHLASHTKPLLWRGNSCSLLEKKTSVRVITHTSLTDPHGSGTELSEEHHGLVTD